MEACIPPELPTTMTVYVPWGVGVGVGVDWLMPPPPPPQLAQIPVQATIIANHIMEPRRRRGDRNPTSTIAGTMPIQLASIHGELGCKSVAVVVRVIVSVAVVVVPAAPKVMVGGLNEHPSPAGKLAQDSVKVCPADAAFAVNETVNVADCPDASVALVGEVATVPALPRPATFKPEPEIATPNTVPLGVPELNFASCLPELMSKR